MVSFLESFEGLEELNIAFRKLEFDFSSLSNAILHHQSTLKSLAIHHRGDMRDDTTHHTSVDNDVPLNYVYASGTTPLDIFRKLRLESLGICISPSILVSDLSILLLVVLESILHSNKSLIFRNECCHLTPLSNPLNSFI